MISTDDLVTHMRGVHAAERDLRDLGVVWRMVESSAAISCPDEVAPILPTLEDTRVRFDELRQRLVDQMVLENQAELADELSAKAQCAIDILVRNLYERTADVGFLATDDVVRAYCGAGTRSDAERAAMVERLAAYQAKYTVYDDIILLSTEGAVLARLDGQATIAATSDPLVAEALSGRGYVEHFRASDLAASPAPALLYAHRIEAADGRAVGVLVLRFRFADEMRRIFDSINAGNLQLALVLVDAQQRVVASNDEAHVPIGAQLAPVDGSAIALTAFAGREYLAVRRASPGYQGYAGPAWRAQAMVSLLTAFRQRDNEDPGGEVVPLDNAELVAMNRNADAINRDLRRVVWNGRLMAGNDASDPDGVGGGDRGRLKAVLKQVNQTGMRTRQRVARAIQDIHRTSLARARRQTRELARLAADIMDRNLYERANDCRWWALSPVLREQLAAAEPDAQALARVLDGINRLYTVYSRLVAFDAQGLVRATSRGSEGDGLVGSTVPAAWLKAVSQLGDAQRYAVSPFEDTPLHDQGPTYVYLAAVRPPGDERRVVGGIAIVFNAAAELAAMLRDVMADRAGFAAFVDAQGQVLAASDPALAAGVVHQLGGRAATLLDHEGTHYAVASMQAGGYREFKNSDGYDNGVRAVIGLRLGASERRHQQLSERDLASPGGRGGAARETLEAAVFQVGAGRYALPSAHVMEAIAPKGLVHTPGTQGAAVGMIEVPAPGGPRLVPALCARRLFGLDYPARAGDGVLLVVRSALDDQRPAFALRVDDVLTVLDVPREKLHPAPAGFRQFAPWVVEIAECEAVGPDGTEPVLVQLLDSRLVGGADAEPAVDSLAEADALLAEAS